MKVLDDRKFKCGVANCIFASKYASSLKRHIARVHGPKPSVTLSKHVPKVIGAHPTRKHTMALSIPSHACQVPGCGRRFKLANTLRQHMADRHNVNVKWVYCDLCQYRAKRPSTLKQHRADIHNMDFEWHHCSIPGCTYRAKTKTRIRLHLAGRHNIGAKYVSCKEPGCTYQCKTHQRQNLKRHMMNVHGKGTSGLSNSEDHVVVSAEENSPSPDV